MADHGLHYRYYPLLQDIICAATAIAALPARLEAPGGR